MKLKELGIWFGVIVILIGGFWLLINAVNSPSLSAPVDIKIPEVSSQDFTKGNPKAKVTLVEYADFQCPACALVHSIIKKLEGDFKTDLRLVYRPFPLIETHPNAMISTQAIYAASLQRKFWEMHDLIYENQAAWDKDKNAKSIFIEYAKKLELNLTKFEADISSEDAKKFVTNAYDKAISLGIDLTPSIFVNGMRIQNPLDYEAFKKIIQDEINKK